MGFSDFIGNASVTANLRRMLARERLPHGIILNGAEGAGKFTLAQMLAKAMLCLSPRRTDGLPDFCGVCDACRRIAGSDDLESRIAEAVEVRENLREADKRETRIFVQSHPDILIVPPDPPQLLVKVDQVRRVTESIYFRPAQGEKKIYIFSDSRFMKEAANALLKVLEEPPEYAHLLLLTRNAGELLATLRSRCITINLAPIPNTELEKQLAHSRPELSSKQRNLAARLSNGAYGRALKLDLQREATIRQEAVLLLTSAASGQDHSALFRATESFRAGAEGAEKMQATLRALASLLEDLLYILSGSTALVRNSDLQRELESLAGKVDFNWCAQAGRQLVELEASLRRNPLRGLALDAFSLGLEEAPARK